MVDDTLQERKGNYGSFTSQGEISQDFKKVLHTSPNWDKLKASQKEALEMIVHKISRVLNGNPDYADSWHDIQGYAKLIENELEEMIADERAKLDTQLGPATKW